MSAYSKKSQHAALDQLKSQVTEDRAMLTEDQLKKLKEIFETIKTRIVALEQDVAAIKAFLEL